MLHRKHLAGAPHAGLNLIGDIQNAVLLCYLVEFSDSVEAIIVPVTVDDGFNGVVELLVAVDMRGYILSARVVKDISSRNLLGQVDIISSRWMREFDNNSMRDIQRIGWQTITAEDEYDQFVGASITP